MPLTTKPPRSPHSPWWPPWPFGDPKYKLQRLESHKLEAGLVTSLQHQDVIQRTLNFRNPEMPCLRDHNFLRFLDQHQDGLVLKLKERNDLTGSQSWFTKGYFMPIWTTYPLWRLSIVLTHDLCYSVNPFFEKGNGS